MQVLTVLFFVALVGIIVLFAHMFSLERRKKIAAYAKSKGLHFAPDKDKKIDSRYSSFKCLRRGHSRYAYNIMRGKRDGRDLTAFDYHYVTGHGKSRRVHNFSALTIRSPLPLKPLYLRPENIFDKVTDFFGFDDIDFESAEFSRKFYVKSPEKRKTFQSRLATIDPSSWSVSEQVDYHLVRAEIKINGVVNHKISDYVKYSGFKVEK